MRQLLCHCTITTVYGFQTPHAPLDKATGPRFVPSSRGLTENFIISLHTLRLTFEIWLRTGFFQNTKNAAATIAKVQGWVKALHSHWFLFSIHLWLDVLHVESWDTDD